MNLSVTRGTRKITATKPEMKALRSGLDVLAAYIGVNPTDLPAQESLKTQMRIINELEGTPAAPEAAKPETATVPDAEKPGVKPPHQEPAASTKKGG